MKRVLITGITGFVGSHLAEYLLTKDVEIYGVKRWRSRTENIDHIIDKIRLLEADLRDAHSVEEIIKKSEPDYIFHLAAQSFVPMSWSAPSETLETNIISTVNLLESVRKSEVDSRIQIAGSSEEYGMVHSDELPIKEDNPLRPLSPYGVSKVAQDKLSYQYNKSYGIKTVLTRAFNHTGPRRGEVFVTSNFSKQIAQIEKGIKEPVIYVGNLETIRDFSDVRDIVKAYWVSLEKCNFGEAYNICSGKGLKIKTVIEMLIGLCRKKGIELRKDPERMRPSDVMSLVGNCSKFKEVSGWEQETPFEKTLEDLVNFWRERIK